MVGGRSYVLEDPAYSMAIHIIFDLPYALERVGTSAGHLPDYRFINEVLAARTDRIEDAVAERYQRSLAWLDRLAGNFGRFFTNYGIRMSRSVAWYNALRLHSPDREGAAGAIERSTGLFIQSVRRPDEWWLRIGVSILRAVVPRFRRWPPAEDELGRGRWLHHRDLVRRTRRARYLGLDPPPRRSGCAG